MRAVFRWAVPMVLLLVACSRDLGVADLYGTWQLVEVTDDPDATHVVGEILQLTPGHEAIYQGEGVRARRIPFQTHWGILDFPEPGKPDEGLLLLLEDEREMFEVRMPTRNQLILVPNGITSPVLSYRRAR
jgi:hypothetical protein